MGRSTKVSGASVPKQATRQSQNLGSYVYGIVPAGTKVPADVQGLGDPAGKVRVIEHEGIAALVSDVNVDQPLGRPGDFLAHEGLLDAVAAEGAVLPFRFGGVLASADAVVEELLAPHHDDFASALEQIKGHTEFVVKGRYDERTVLAEILAESPEAQGLRQAIKGKPEDATRNERIRLGEIITASVEAKRAMDTQMLLDGLSGHYIQASLRDPTHEWDAVHVALLAKRDGQKTLEKAMNEFGERWAGRVDMRLLGPMAPYDFVIAQG
ncbi:GvpL/GvpF family gas vesicle protein [Nonomuraea gerenzanensis]|uniref:Possible gas vesicle synthesis protein n=1 Tax=Nonomuraea gerenzanensis TaxID=93944 RepID=A0A1M4E0C8_9ACTN|nr:GvpL/GvpF family gas vesicle protein [Nonomuraea gerenzanensis]UBU14557.1 GvpL/GvpF family gas vesicle protein [Nonomuraea gerenzanensis]SBO92273.1 possible gas vesicle synthesis protein [Nonomuraea gerenzanensis]